MSDQKNKTTDNAPPAAASNNAPPPPANNVPPTGGGKTQTVSLRHTSPYDSYRRVGLVLTDQFRPYEATKEQLEILEKDPWVEIGK